MTIWKSIVTTCYGLKRVSKDSILMNQSLFFLYLQIGLLAFFIFLRKWKAKAE